MDAAKAQPSPVPSQGRILDQVIADLQARAEDGKKQYGRYLQAYNGRNAGVDLYQELLDAAMYARQRIVEEEEDRRLLLQVYKLVTRAHITEEAQITCAALIRLVLERKKGGD